MSPFDSLIFADAATQVPTIVLTMIVGLHAVLLILALGGDALHVSVDK